MGGMGIPAPGAPAPGGAPCAIGGIPVPGPWVGALTKCLERRLIESTMSFQGSSCGLKAPSISFKARRTNPPFIWAANMLPLGGVA
jgi:hypothetical protein